MADVHPFPTPANGEVVKRLTAKLKAAFEAGEALGSRASHINALAETLERTLIGLDLEVHGLRSNLSPSEIEILLRDSGFDKMRDKLKRLIANAHSFHVADRE